jgi:zinc ribbon protein
MNCSSCGTALAPTAKFCHKCGAKVGAPPSTTAASWQVGLPWGIAGAALGALVIVLATRGGNSAGGQSPSGAPFAGSAPPPGAMATTDISQMSPEEAAKRLFDRVMRLDSEGKKDSVLFFFPMAIGAYNQLPARDADAHFDLGILYVAGNDAPSALAQADTILRQAPTHLYGFVLRAKAYQLQNNATGLRKAYADFLKNEAAERRRARPEYAEHSNILDAYHQQATAARSQ